MLRPIKMCDATDIARRVPVSREANGNNFDLYYNTGQFQSHTTTDSRELAIPSALAYISLRSAD